MKKTIAMIELAPGCSRFFDPLTHIDLSLGRKMASVPEGCDYSNIRRALKEHKIQIAGGAIPPVTCIKPKQELKVEKIKDKKVEIKKEEEKKEVEVKKVKSLTLEDPKKEEPKVPQRKAKSNNKKKVNVPEKED